MQTIVIGHKNPDMDSICSAIAYARLKELLGMPGVIPARAGNTNARIDFVLTKFGVETPIFLSDASPRVGDVMQREVASVRADSSAYDALQLIAQKQLRGLPVTDSRRSCLGLLSADKLSHYLFPAREEAANARKTVASLRSIVETIGGKVVAGSLSDESEEHILMVAAMNADSFSKRLESHNAHQVVLFVGDREDIQMRAIEAGVRAVVVTGGLGVLKGVQAAALRSHIAIISSPYDTATTVLLARGAVSAGRMVEPFTSFSPDTLLEAARQTASASASYVFPVLDEDGALIGVLSKSDFIKPPSRQLILVDHNEMSQAVPGADTVPIIEILDHHRVGGFSSALPILFWNNPVGSTSTIVTLCYEQAGIAIPPDMAGVLMAGLISDTLSLTSPTATQIDKDVLQRLSRIAGVDPEQLAREIFAVGSPLLTMTAEEAVLADCKEYHEYGKRFTISQIEELSFSHLGEKQQALNAALDAFRRANGLFFSALMVTDINTQNSVLLASGAEDFLQRINLKQQSSRMWELQGIVSRKKQLLPYLVQLFPANGHGKSSISTPVASPSSRAAAPAGRS